MRAATDTPESEGPARPAEGGRCPVHPDEPVVGLCGRCDAFVCAKDQAEVRGLLFCQACARRREVQVEKGEGRTWSRAPAHRQVWRSFGQARAFVHGLALRSSNEWDRYVRGERPGLPRRPPDVPATPAKVYRDEWLGWDDWLGPAATAPRWRPFADARAFVQGLGLKTKAEWWQLCDGALPGRPALPPDIPRWPNRAVEYRGQWQHFDDWLGTGKVPGATKRFRPFDEARAFARGLGLATGVEWERFAKGLLPDKGRLPDDVPVSPGGAYRGQFRGWGDWLGTGKVANVDRVFRPFEEARAFVRSLGLACQPEWERWARGDLPEKGRRPADIPFIPWRTYAGSWKGMNDWLGTEPRSAAARPFDEARAFARSLGLSGVVEWHRYARGRRPDLPPRPKDVPTHPERAYADEWRGWFDWLGTALPTTWSFPQARAFARSQRLTGVEAWEALVLAGSVPQLPLRPERRHADFWTGWGPFLGSGPARPTPDELAARAVRCAVHGAPATTVCARCEAALCEPEAALVEGAPYCPACATLPVVLALAGARPRRVRRPPREYRPFEDARALARGLRLQSKHQWLTWARGELGGAPPRPADVPASPTKAYRREWQGWADWLGPCFGQRRRRRWRPFAEAREYARGLGLRTADEWVAFVKGQRPDTSPPSDLPAHADAAYKDEWQGWGDFLGTQRVANTHRRFRPFEDARAFVRALGLAGSHEWHLWSAGKLLDKGVRPTDIPGNPYKIYPEWAGFADWLGGPARRTTKARARPFEAARTFARGLGLRSKDEWTAYAKGERARDLGLRPPDVPANPRSVYEGEWQGWSDWLGNGRRARPRQGGRRDPRPDAEPS